MSNEDMVFTSDATKAINENKKLAAEYGNLGKAILASANASQTSAKIATDAWKQHNVAMQSVITAHDRMKGQLDDVKEKMANMKSGVAIMSGIGSAIGSQVIPMIQAMIDKQHEYNMKLAESGRLHDAMNRDLKLQAGISDKEFDDKKWIDTITKASNKAGIANEITKAVMKEMLSSDVKEEHVRGESLDRLLLSGMAAGTARSPEAMTQYTSAMITMLKSNGQEATPENIGAMGQRFAGVKLPTNMEVEDLKAYAGINSLMKNYNIDYTEGFSAQMMLKNLAGYDTGKANVGVRNFATKLGGGLSTKAKDLIDKMAGKKDASKDFDFVGEDFQTVIANFNSMLSRGTKESQNEIMSEVFGAENIGSATEILKRPDEIRTIMGFMNDKDALANGVRSATAGIDVAEIRRLNNLEQQNYQKEKDAARKATTIEVMKQRMRMAGTPDMIASMLGYGIGVTPYGVEAIEGWSKVDEVAAHPDADGLRAMLAMFPFLSQAGGAIGRMGGPSIEEAKGLELPSELAPLAVPDVNIPALGRTREWTGPKVNLSTSDLDLERARLENERDRAQIKLDEATINKRADGKLSTSDRKDLVPMKDVVDRLDILIKLNDIEKRKRNAGVE